MKSIVRDLQDKMRNRGWRIEWIPWQKDGTPEYVFNTRLTYFLLLVGLGMFFGGIFTSFDNSWLGIGLIVSGCFVLFGSRLVAAYQKQNRWIKMEVTCIDREVKAGRDSEGDIFWNFRLLCVFVLNGEQYKVTPENSRMVSFNNEHQVNEYLNSRISAENKCFLYIDPKNPLHAVFDRKQKI